MKRSGIILKWMASFVGVMIPTFACGENVGFGAVVTDCGQLENVIGDNLLVIDSLSVTGPIDDTDFATMLRGIIEGKISILNLENAQIEDNYMYMYAFKGAKGLKKISLPHDLRYIGWGAFEDCVDLCSIGFNQGLNGIDAYTFAGCTSLKSANLCNGIRLIGEYAFINCSLDSIVIPPSVNEVGEAAFAGNQLKKIYLMPNIAPEAINRLVNCVDCDKDLFHNSTAEDIPAYVPVGASERYRSVDGWDYLTNYIEIPIEDFPEMPNKGELFVAQVSAEGELADMLSGVDSAIDSLVVKGPVDERDFYAMWTKAHERNMEVIDLREAKVKGGIIPPLAFACRFEPEYRYLMPVVRRIMLPEDIVEIGDSAFWRNSMIEILDLPAQLPTLGKACFSGCKRLEMERLVIPEGMTAIADSCFLECGLLKEIVLPSTLTHIGDYALSGTGITSIKLPEALTCLGDHALRKTKITSLELPPAIEHIGKSALSATNLTGIELPPSLTSIGDYAFCATKLKEIVLTPQLKSVGEGAFASTPIENIVFPETGIEFGNRVFSYCHELQKVTLPDWMEMIPEYMFYHCEKLREVIHPSSLKEICKYAFAFTGLEELNFPEGLEVIGESAFYSANFDSVTLPSSVKKIGLMGFSPRNRLKRIRSYCKIPPESEDWHLKSHDYSETSVYIPEGTRNLYTTAPFWKRFRCYYQVRNSSDVDMSPVDDGTREPVEIYNASGVQVYRGMLEDANLPSGLYIVKSAAGTHKIYR